MQVCNLGAIGRIIRMIGIPFVYKDTMKILVKCLVQVAKTITKMNIYHICARHYA